MTDTKTPKEDFSGTLARVVRKSMEEYIANMSDDEIEILDDQMDIYGECFIKFTMGEGARVIEPDDYSYLA